jgi:hypothetical protein
MNLYVEYQHFKQEHLAFALDLIQKYDFLTGLNVPSFLGTKNKLEINCPSTGQTF